LIIAWSFTGSRSIANVEQQPRLTFRAARRIAGLLLLFLLIAPLHVLTKLLFGRSGWPRRFLAAATRAIGVRVTVRGRPARQHTLLVANHLSWLDIVILGGATNCTFVSKDELGHGLLHWLADQNQTVYVKRSHRKGAKEQALTVAKSLEGEKPVTVFAEGTTGPGTHLLPFRSTLLEAANFAAKDVEVRPLALDYGAATVDVAWHEESGASNAMRQLSRRGVLPVSVHLLDPLDRSLDRKQLAAAARAAVAQKLGFKSDVQSPIDVAE
jgi:1-acyl-sn-glycerol-3-phosphate acyltransferase